MFITLIINCLLIIFNFYLLIKLNQFYKQKVNHINIFSIVWTITLLGSLLFPFETIHIKSETYLILIISWTFILLFSMPFKYIEKNPISINNYHLRRLKLILYILIALSVIAYLINLSEIFNYVTDLESWADKRKTQSFDEVLGDNLFYTIFARNNAIIIPITMFLFIKGRINKTLLSLVLLYGLISSAIYFTRAPILEFLMITFISYIFILNKSLSKKVIFNLSLLVILFISLFIFSQSFLTSNSKGFEEVKSYLFSGVNNLQNIINGNYIDFNKYDIKLYSFDFINYILKKISLIDSYPSYVREWAPNIVSNTYTFLDAFLLDFGILGVIVGSAAIGYLGKYFYTGMIKTKSIFFISVYGMFSYYCAMTFMNNEFIRFSFLLFIMKAFIVDLLTKKNKQYENS